MTRHPTSPDDHLCQMDDANLLAVLGAPPHTWENARTDLALDVFNIMGEMPSQQALDQTLSTLMLYGLISPCAPNDPVTEPLLQTRSQRIYRALAAHLRIRPASGEGMAEVPSGLGDAASALSKIGSASSDLWVETISRIVFDRVGPTPAQARRNLWVLTGLAQAVTAIRSVDERSDASPLAEGSAKAG